MDANPFESPETASSRPKQSKPPKSYLLRWLLGGVVLVLLIGLLLPAKRQAREAGRRTKCINNLHQIGVALHNYARDHGGFPPAYTVDAQGKPLHSWRTLLLPSMEYAPLYKQIDLSKPWNDPVNKALCETDVQAYRCPSSQVEGGKTLYLGVVAPGGLFQPNKIRKLSEITDGTAQTLMVVEVDEDHAVPWACPTDATEPIIMGLKSSARPPHANVIPVVFADGSAATLSVRNLTDEQLKALISIAGNDDAIARKAIE
jgi:hypothetical protein